MTNINFQTKITTSQETPVSTEQSKAGYTAGKKRPFGRSSGDIKAQAKAASLGSQSSTLSESGSNKKFKAIPGIQGSLEEWAKRLISDNQNKSIRTLLENHRDHFENGDLSSTSSYEILKQRLEGEIKKLKTFEEFIEIYSSGDIFKFGLISKNSVLIQHLMIDYFIRNPALIYDEKVKTDSASDALICKWQLIEHFPSFKSELAKLKESYLKNQNLNTYLDTIHHIDLNYQFQMQPAIEIRKQVESTISKANVDQAKINYDEITKKQESVKSQIKKKNEKIKELEANKKDAEKTRAAILVKNWNSACQFSRADSSALSDLKENINKLSEKILTHKGELEGLKKEKTTLKSEFEIATVQYQLEQQKFWVEVFNKLKRTNYFKIEEKANNEKANALKYAEMSKTHINMQFNFVIVNALKKFKMTLPKVT